MDKYVILDEVADENNYLVGFENGKIGYITKEFERDTAVDLHSQWRLIKVMNGTSTFMVDVDVTGRKSIEIKKFISINIGFQFRGAYVPELQMWIYMVNSYKKLTAKS